MNILDKIVAHKKEEIKTARNRIPEQTLYKQAMEHHKKRRFQKCLENPGPTGMNIIAEIKRASPSKGVIRKDLDPAQFALEYEKGGAAALSVLTDRFFFHGSDQDLKKAREVSTLPILRKDFIISSYQLFESLIMGADAVLLIVRILEKEQLKDYFDICNELGIDALVEIHSQKDLESANFAGARLIGINNRNLKSFETDIKTSLRIKSMIKPGQIAVAASGIQSRIDIEKNLESGIINFLIGESLVRSQNRIRFLQSLHGQSKNS